MELLPGPGYRINNDQAKSITTVRDAQANAITFDNTGIRETIPSKFVVRSNNIGSGETVNISYTIDNEASSAKLPQDYNRVPAGTTGTIALSQSSNIANINFQGVQDNVYETAEEVVIHFTSSRRLV